MSGYDIRRLLRSLGWLFGNPSFGTIYPALHALLEDGLVTVEVVPHPNRPARKIYTITENGEQALQRWVAQPPRQGAGLRAFIMYLIVTGNSARDQLAAHLRSRPPRAPVAAVRLPNRAPQSADAVGPAPSGQAGLFAVHA